MTNQLTDVIQSTRGNTANRRHRIRALLNDDEEDEGCGAGTPGSQADAIVRKASDGIGKIHMSYGPEYIEGKLIELLIQCGVVKTRKAIWQLSGEGVYVPVSETHAVEQLRRRFVDAHGREIQRYAEKLNGVLRKANVNRETMDVVQAHLKAMQDEYGKQAFALAMGQNFDATAKRALESVRDESFEKERDEAVDVFVSGKQLFDVTGRGKCEPVTDERRQQMMRVTKAASPVLMEHYESPDCMGPAETPVAVRVIAAALLANRASNSTAIHLHGDGAQDVAELLMELAGSYAIKTTAQTLSKAQSAQKFKGIRMLLMNNSASIGRAIRNLQKLGVPRLLPIVVANDRDDSPPAITEDRWKIVQWEVPVAPSLSELAGALRRSVSNRTVDVPVEVQSYEEILRSIAKSLLSQYFRTHGLSAHQRGDANTLEKIPLRELLEAVRGIAAEQHLGLLSLALTQQMLAHLCECEFRFKVVRPSNRYRLHAYQLADNPWT